MQSPRRSFRGQGPRFRRFRRGLRPSTEVQKCEVGHFHVASSIGAGASSYNLTMIDVASVSNLQIAFGASGTTPAVGRVMGQMARSIDVLGVIWDSRTILNQSAVAAVTAWAQVWEFWALIRLTAAGGPSELPDLSQSTFPTATAPGSAEDDTNQATRMLFRRFTLLPIGANNVVAPAQVDCYSPRRLRVRRKFTDAFGLFFGVAVLQSTLATQQFTNILDGQIYYRVRF